MAERCPDTDALATPAHVERCEPCQQNARAGDVLARHAAPVRIESAQLLDSDMEGRREVLVILSDDRHFTVHLDGDSIDVIDGNWNPLARFPLCTVPPESRP